MASDRYYLDHVLQQLSDLEEISYRPMMGEFIIYYQGTVIGGIYDNRFLLKYTESAEKLLPEAELQAPYEGAKGMLVVDPDDRDVLNTIIPAIRDDLVNDKKGKKQRKSV